MARGLGNAGCCCCGCCWATFLEASEEVVSATAGRRLSMSNFETRLADAESPIRSTPGLPLRFSPLTGACGLSSVAVLSNWWSADAATIWSATCGGQRNCALPPDGRALASTEGVTGDAGRGGGAQWRSCASASRNGSNGGGKVSFG